MTLIKSTNPAYHFLKCSKTTVGVQISTVRKTNIHRTWWRKCTDESARLCTQM